MLQSLSIRYKIGFIAVIGFVGFVIFQAASYRLSINIRDQLQTILSEDFTLLKFSNDIQVNFSNLDKLYQASLAEADMDTLIEADAKATQMKLQFETLKGSFGLNEPLFNELQRTFSDYINRTSAHTAAVLGNSLDYERTLEGYTEIGLLRERYEKVQTNFLEERYKTFEAQLIVIEEEEEYLVQFGLILGVILTCVLLLVSFVIIRSLISAFNNAVTVAEQIANGNLNQRIETVAKDETGQLMQSLHAMRDALKTQYDDNQQREKVQSFLGGLNETMRGDKTLEELASGVLEYLALHFQAQLGSVFMLSDTDELCRVATYAYPSDDYVKRCFKLGETMVGQVAMDKRPQILTDIPDDYVQVSTGVGNAVPRSIMLVPVLFEGRLKGLVELATFRRFSDEDLYLMRRCNDAIAIAINSAQSRLQMSNMLLLEQQQAAELEHQSQALSLSNSALEDRSKELDKQNAQLEQSRAALLEKSKALEISGKYKSQFLSTMSHELRTPLNSILILSEALMDNPDRVLSEKQVQHAQVINTAGIDLLTLINDILDLSKVEEGKMDVVIDDIDAHEFALNLLRSFEYVAKDKGLEYTVTVADDVVEHFYTDNHRLTQIIKNFISNALKFTDEGGVYVDIAKPKAPFLPTREDIDADSSLLFTVRDTGVGIPKDKQSLVFEAFKQADGTTSRQHGGTGLGLTISTELAKLLGGEIILESKGEGATFALIIPLGNSDFIRQDANLSSRWVEAERDVVESHRDLPAFAGTVNDLLVITDDSHLLKKIRGGFDKCSNVSNLSINVRSQLADIKHLSEEIHTKLFLVDGKQLDDGDWQELSTYLQQTQPKYGVLAIMADKSMQARIEALGALYVDRKLLLGEEDSAYQALSMVCDLTHYEQKRVLVVEDNPVFNEVIRTLFNKNDVPVSIVVNGAQALNLLRHPSFASLIVDLNLPDYSDVALLSRIRQLEGYRRTPVTVFTAEDLDPSRLANILQYADQVVLKSPQAITDLCLQAKQVLQQQSVNDNVTTSSDDSGQISYEAGQLQGCKVLLVDDDERNLYSISSILESEGLTVVCASSGAEALTYIAEDATLQLILLDIMMPDMDGYDVLKTLRTSPQLPQLPVIALTAKAMVGDRERCLAAGATEYLSKPIDKMALLHCISSLWLP